MYLLLLIQRILPFNSYKVAKNIKNLAYKILIMLNFRTNLDSLL